MKQNKKDNTLINSFLMDWVLQRILVSGCVLQASYGVSPSVLQCGTSRVSGVLATPVLVLLSGFFCPTRLPSMGRCKITGEPGGVVPPHPARQSLAPNTVDTPPGTSCGTLGALCQGFRKRSQEGSHQCSALNFVEPGGMGLPHPAHQ